MPGYKAKTIKAIITKKLNAWIESVEDEKVKDLLKNNVIVTGGCIVSMLLGEDVNDFDIYLRNRETALAVAEYYVAKFKEKQTNKTDFELYVSTEPDWRGNDRVAIVAKSAGIAGDEGKNSAGEYKYFEAFPDEQGSAYVSRVMDNPEEIEDVHEDASIEAKRVEGEGKFRPVFLSGNAITLSDKIQIVLRFFGSPDEIHENYDFVHCTSYYQNWDGTLVLRPAALESILSKELRYVGSKYPICSLVRLRKFISRGWRINAGQVLKMSMQVSELDLTDIKVLQDQLTGVDTAYFVQLIERLKEKDPEKVDTAYLVEIIDRMF
jgi:hypothetical protein